MQPHEFANQMGRLARGFGQDLTRERIDALYNLYGNVPDLAVHYAVDVLLTGERFPTPVGMKMAFDAARSETPSGNRGSSKFPGGFRDDGSFNPDGLGVDHVTRFVRYLIKRIREEYASPAEIAQAIRAASEAPAFREDTVVAWEGLTSYALWPCAPVSSAAEQAVKSHGSTTVMPWSDAEAWSKRCKAAAAYAPQAPLW